MSTKIEAKFGLHVHMSTAKTKTMSAACQYYADRYDIKAAQIYTLVPKGKSHDINLGPADEYKKLNIPIFVHASHTTAIFGDSKVSGRALCQKQAEAGWKVGAQGLVVHLPKDPKSVLPALENFPPLHIPLLFENRATKEPYTKPDIFNTLAETIKMPPLISTSNLHSWGFCLDTAHLWSSNGGNAHENYKTMHTWLNGLSIQAANRFKLIHLNGSFQNMASGIDKHAPPVVGAHVPEGILNDQIWGKYIDEDEEEVTVENLKKSSLAAVIQFAKSHDIPMVLEMNDTGTDDDIDYSLRILQDLAESV